MEQISELNEDDYAAQCAWSDFRDEHGVHPYDFIRFREHRAFFAGFTAAESRTYSKDDGGR